MELERRNGSGHRASRIIRGLHATLTEGLESVDEDGLDAAAVEVADLVRYYGGSGVARATRAVVVQFKYSIARATTPLRAADLASTLAKFALTDASLTAKHGATHVDAVVAYEFATNRPIHPGLVAAVAATLDGRRTSGDVARQAGQLAEALAASGGGGAALLRRLSILGGQGNLPEAERNVARTLASWSAPSDPDAEKRLLKLRNLIRIKAGAGSEEDKSVTRRPHSRRAGQVPPVLAPAAGRGAAVHGRARRRRASASHRARGRPCRRGRAREARDGLRPGGDQGRGHGNGRGGKPRPDACSPSRLWSLPRAPRTIPQLTRRFCGNSSRT